MYILTLFITMLFVVANDSSEQIAFNYFATEIINKNYPDSKSIYFSGYTESEKSIAGPFAGCFESEYDFSQLYYMHKKVESEKISIESINHTKLHLSSKVKSKQLNLKIYRAVTDGEIVYVYIKVFKEKYFVDHYLLKISSNKQVVDVCHSSEII